jgi:class 3 adenylate cyclase/tetratricopeptide (TPR) repeat protein
LHLVLSAGRHRDRRALRRRANADRRIDRTYTLGEFFDIWGQRRDRDHVEVRDAAKRSDRGPARRAGNDQKSPPYTARMEIPCGSCGSGQPSGARFCSSCGSALYAACAACGVEQVASAAFCASCGYQLRTDRRRAEPVTDSQERRVVTVVFADLAGSTALGEQLDPEDVRQLQGELFELVNAEIERFEGVTEKFVGDAILAVFGIPRAHEDDPERAVRAALAIQDAFPRLRAQLFERFGTDVALRIGVNTGEVVAGREAAARGELMVSGDVVNVAARLQQAADPGRVLVGERTRRATSRAVVYSDQPPVDAKGKRDPVPAWVAESIRPEIVPRGGGGLRAPLIAREDEMAILTALVRRVVRDRAPQLVTLFGPAGVGKSRLLAELVERVAHVVVLTGRCLPYGDEMTYWALGEAVKAHAGVLESEPTAVAREKLRADVERIVGPEADAVLTPIEWTIGLDLPGNATPPHDVTHRLHSAWRRYFLGLGRQSPTLLAVEDIHWASPQLLDLLEHLAETLADAPVLIVCTARHELLESRSDWGAAKQNATALTLSPLGADDSTHLMTALLGDSEQLGEIGERVLQQAEGNPFFVEEMLEMLIERRVLVRRNGSWDVSEELAALPLPDSVHGVIAARIDLLDAEPREALRRCSVVGRVFWPAAAGVTDDDLVPLTSRGLIAEQPSSSVAGAREFAFKHALTRDVAYATLPRGERRPLHRRVADWILEVAPDRGLEAAEIAAYHYGEALRYGEESEEVAERAATLLLVAGRGALQRLAFDTAERHFSRSAEIAVSDRTRAAALLALGELAVLRSDALDVADRFLKEAIAVAPADATELRSDALAWQSRVLWLTGRWLEALTAADAAVDILRDRGESPQLARALARRSQIAMLRDTADAGALAQEALDVAERVGDEFAAVNARINLVTVQAFAGRAPDGEQALELIRTARDIGASEEAYRCLINFIWAAAGYLPVDRVLATADEGRTLLQDVIEPAGLEWYLPLSVAQIHLLPAGRLDEIEQLVGDLDVQTVSPNNRILALGLQAQLLIRRGAADEAAPLAEPLRELAMKSGEPQRIIPMTATYLPWAFLAGRADELRDVAERAAEAVNDRWAVTLTALPAVRALAAAGEVPTLRAWLASFHRAGAARSGRMATTVAAAEGLVALHEGRLEDAVQQLKFSADTDRSLGYAFDAATTEVDLATALTASGDDDSAAKLRAASDAYFESIGCTNRL